ncbi:putative signal transduction histidine-protein kinase [Naviculisporaceae sp. PSN 640]
MAPRNSSSSGDHTALRHDHNALDHDKDPDPDIGTPPHASPFPPDILSPAPTDAYIADFTGHRHSPDSKNSIALTQLGGNRFVRDTPNLSPGAPRSQSASPFRLAMPSTSPGQLAFSAIQFLPMPVLVLDNLKTVALANEAMGRLLGVPPPDGTANVDGMAYIMDHLRGQSLSQVGIDLMQANGPVWIEWEQFLDQLADEFGSGKATPSPSSAPSTDGHTTPTGAATVDGIVDGESDGIPANTSYSPAHNAAVEVVISKRNYERTAFDSAARSKLAEFQAYAKMIISPWELGDGQTYFTLTFTHTETHSRSGKSYTSRPGTIELADGDSASKASGPPSQASTASHDSRSPSLIINPSSVSLSSSPFPPLGPPSTSSISSSPSILQKVTIMKDALLDNTQTPILAMWKDGSVTFPNRASRELFSRDADLERARDGFELLPAWTLWDEEFTRQLDVDEYPISVLLRTETPFSGFRVGMRDSEGKRLIFDVEGSAVTDEHTGEFLAGVVTCRDVTQLREEINEIKAADAERFKLICDTMPQLVWTARPDGSHDFFNSRWYSYTGLSEEESLGAGWRNPFHPDDLEETQARWQHCLRTGEPYMTEYRCRRKDGEWRWFLGRALPLRNKNTGEIEKWFGTCTDVHESIEAKLEARRTRQQLLSVIAHSRMTMFTVDLNRAVTMLEGALIWDSHTEYNGSNKWYIGENVYEVFNRLNSQLPEGQMPPFLKPLEAVLAGQATEDIQEHEMEGRWYRTRLQPMMEKSRDGKGTKTVEGVIGLIMDVTELKARERDIEAQAREKRQLVANEAAAKEASRLKSQFLANMSHEIRTPITGVMGLSELLLDLELAQEQKELVENIYRSGSALLTVINDILDFSKVESGRLDIEEVQFSLSVIIRDVRKMLSFAADKKNLEFEADIAGGIDSDLVVLGDPGRVRQIITNLLTNSIKFTNQGYVKFSVKIEKQDTDVVEIRFTIEDTGIGIEEDVRKRLFQPFSQGDASTARRFGGTGLGLTISKNLLDLMNGRITLESTVGVGTTATFWIPFKRPQGVRSSNLVRIDPLSDRLQSETSMSCNSLEFDRALGTPSDDHASNPPDRNRSPWRNASFSASAASRDDELQPADRAKLHILVVEDNDINQKIAIKTIQKLGFSVTAAWNGHEALKYVAEAKLGLEKRPDVILMDVQMPGIDGYLCTHLLRYHSPYKAFMSDIPIVAMTASAIQGDKEKCRRAGMDDYLAKPVKGKILENMLLRWLTRSRRPNIIPRGGSARSTCSDNSHSCDNSDIPLVGVHEDDNTAFLVSHMKERILSGDDLTAAHVDEKDNSLPTPRPLNHDSRDLLGGGSYFHFSPGDRDGGHEGATGATPTEYGRVLTSPDPTKQATALLNTPSQHPIIGSGGDGYSGVVAPLDSPQDGDTVLSPLNKIITAEMAMQSRADKLLDAAGAGGGSMSMSSALGSTHGQGNEPGGEALTVENVGLLEEQEERKNMRRGKA